MKKYLCKIALFFVVSFAIISMIEAFVPYNPQGFTRAQLIKDSMLANPERDSCIVLLGGSSVVYGFQSGVLKEKTGYNVINDGLQAGIGLKMNIDDCSQYLKAGDILVLAPEYSHFADDNAYGGLPLADVVYLDLRRYLPLLNGKQMLAVLNNTPMHQMEKITYFSEHLMGGTAVDKLYNLNSLNEYGDKVAHYGLPSKQLPPATSNQGGTFNEDFFEYLTNSLTDLQDRGVRIIVLPPPATKSLYEANEKWVETVNERLASVGFPFACSPDECVYPDSLFFDTDYHLSEQGAIMHTMRLTEYIDN